MAIVAENIMETLTELLERIIAEKTFTADALEGIAALKNKAAKLEADLKRSEEVRERLQDQIDALQRQITTQQYNNQAQEEALKKAQAEIEKMTPAKYEAEKQKAIADTLKWSFETLFKPAETRREVQGVAILRSGTKQPDGYYGGGDITQPQTTIETIKEL